MQAHYHNLYFTLDFKLNGIKLLQNLLFPKANSPAAALLKLNRFSRALFRLNNYLLHSKIYFNLLNYYHLEKHNATW